MAQKSTPSYYGLRIYLSTSLLYFFLVIPFLSFLVLQSVPKFVNQHPQSNQDIGALKDTLTMSFDSIPYIAASELDSLITNALPASELDSLATGRPDANLENGENSGGVVSAGPGNDGPFNTYFLLLFLLSVLSYIVGFIYNRGFKQYFKLIRRGRDVPGKLRALCKKKLFHTPVVNAAILCAPSMIVLFYSLVAILSRATFKGEAEHDLFIQLHYLTLVATILEFLFVYYWQKHRVHIKYIDYIYSGEELRKQVFKRKGGKIRNRFLVSSGMTTFLPLVIVIVYLILSLTSLKDLDLENKSAEEREILIGPWSTFMISDKGPFESKKFKRLYYVNAVDSTIMMFGIANGIIVSLIYVFLFIKWTNQDITHPLKELLANIRNTRGGEIEQYTIVRTNDEIGELTEGYNEMTTKIHEYVGSISRMNRDLEKTVKERTNEVVEQKEEIEVQKEEIEAQLDLATAQRDTITRQKDQIIDSIRYAERIQSAILPPLENLSESLTDHFILFKPRDIVSGDYYWTTLKGDKLMIAVADCTGHGVPGAFLSMLGISSMNEIVNRSRTIRANEILEQLRDFVITSLHQKGTRGEAQDGIEIALCVIDTRKKILEYAGANRPLYIVRRNTKKASGKGYQMMHIHADRMPIGIYEQKSISFTNHEIPLEIGDSIYLFSDGYVDQLGGPSRKTFRSKYFRELLLEVQDQSMEEQKQALQDRLDSWRGEVEQIDDILVIGIKI